MRLFARATYAARRGRAALGVGQPRRASFRRAGCARCARRVPARVQSMRRTSILALCSTAISVMTARWQRS